MDESRKIVFVLGNGFDLDLGLKTSYKDFWESKFCPKNYPAPLIHHLNQCWPDGLDSVRWYDLENELLNYYNSIPDPENVQDYITDEEKRFLKGFEAYKYPYGIYEGQKNVVESLFDKGVIINTNNLLCPLDCPYQNDVFQSPEWRDRKAFGLIKQGLCKYLDSVSRPSQEDDTLANHVIFAINKCAKAGVEVSIYTFNYTPVRLRCYPLDGITPHYMHGSCADNNIVIGTRDNLNMVSSYDFLQKAMDDDFMPPDIVTALKEADEVIIFGHSLGQNDRQYFAPFFLAQASVDNAIKKDITIFTRNNDSKRDIKRALQRMTDGNLSALYSINQPVIIRTEDIEEDKHALYAFLNKHIDDEDYTQDAIGKLIQHYGSWNSSPANLGNDTTLDSFKKYDPNWPYSEPIPDKPGNYIVLLRSQHSFPNIGYNLKFENFENMPIIYTGTAGSSLKSRIMSQHLGSNAGLSTLRQSIGCLFRFKQIPRDSNNPNNGHVRFSENDEVSISLWMHEYLVFYYLPNDNPKELEAKLIKQLNPPLNIQKNLNKVNAEFRSALHDLRCQKPWRNKAKEEIIE